MIKIIYWSGTGNTEAMAKSIEIGVKNAGQDCELVEASQAKVEDVQGAEKVAFGCPAMGAEELEETVMRPYMDSVNPLLKGKKILIFGSYEWADGEWMKTWEEEVLSHGAILADDPLAIYGMPDDSGKEECERIGRSLARA